MLISILIGINFIKRVGKNKIKLIRDIYLAEMNNNRIDEIIDKTKNNEKIINLIDNETEYVNKLITKIEDKLKIEKRKKI